MPPRYAYWTIVLDGSATSFRAARRDELVPALYQLRKRDPKATLKWFARGRLWESPTEARAAAARRGRRPRKLAAGATRDRDWRPGGSHRDPRAKFAKQKRKKGGARKPRKG